MGKFRNPNFKLISVNTARCTTKHLATPVISDAKVGLLQLSEALGDWRALTLGIKEQLKREMNGKHVFCKTSGPTNQEEPSYAHAVGAIYREIQIQVISW